MILTRPVLDSELRLATSKGMAIMTPVVSEIQQVGIDLTIQDSAKREDLRCLHLEIVTLQRHLTSILQPFSLARTCHCYGHVVTFSSFSC